jgi:hypothetical protein
MGASASHQVMQSRGPPYEGPSAPLRSAPRTSAPSRSASLRAALPRLARRRSAPRSRLPRRCARRTSAPNRCASIRLVVRARNQRRGQPDVEHRNPLPGNQMVARRPVRDAAAAVVSDHGEAREPERAHDRGLTGGHGGRAAARFHPRRDGCERPQSRCRGSRSPEGRSDRITLPCPALRLTPAQAPGALARSSPRPA